MKFEKKNIRIKLGIHICFCEYQDFFFAQVTQLMIILMPVV